MAVIDHQTPQKIDSEAKMRVSVHFTLFLQCHTYQFRPQDFVWHHAILVQFMVGCDLWQTYDRKTTVLAEKPSFPRKKNLEFLRTCQRCTTIMAGKREEKRQKRDALASDAGENDASKKHRGPPIQREQMVTMPWDKVMELLEDHKGDAFELNVILDLGNAFVQAGNPPMEPSVASTNIVRQIAKRIWEITGYRFMWAYQYAVYYKLTSKAINSLIKVIPQTKSRLTFSSVLNYAVRKQRKNETRILGSSVHAWRWIVSPAMAGCASPSLMGTSSLLLCGWRTTALIVYMWISIWTQRSRH